MNAADGCVQLAYLFALINKKVEIEARLDSAGTDAIRRWAALGGSHGRPGTGDCRLYNFRSFQRPYHSKTCAHERSDPARAGWIQVPLEDIPFDHDRPEGIVDNRESEAYLGGVGA